MLFIITFFLIFGWKINSFIDISAISALALSIQYLLIHKPWKFLLSNKPIKVLLLLTIYSTIIVLINGITDLMPILRAFRALVILIASFSLYSLYQKHYKEPITSILLHIYLCIFIHSLIMNGMYIFTPFRLFVYTITDSSSYVNLNSPYLEGYRICGLTYGLSQTSVLQIFALFLIPFIINIFNKKYYKIFIFLSFPSIIISSLIAGRSGLVAFLVLLPTYIVLKLSSTNFSFNNFINILKPFLLYSLSLIIFGTIAYHYLPKKFIKKNLKECSEIINIIKLKGNSINVLKPMFFLPNEISTTIFGKGNYGRTFIFYLLSDVGWVKSIFAIGIIGTLLMIYPFLWGIYNSFKIRKYLMEPAIITIIFLLASLMLNFKELSLLTRNQWTIQAILLAIISIKLQDEIAEK